MNGILLGFNTGQMPQYHCTAALATHVAVSGLVEGVAAARG